VVVTHNEGERLCQAVAGLVSTAPVGAEVIVVDDFSDDGSIELLRRSHPSVRIVRPPRRSGPPTARNFGAQFATGPMVVWSDAHVHPEPGWFSALAALLADPGVGAAGPAIAVLGNESSVGFGLRWKSPALEAEWLPRQRDEPYVVPSVCGCFMAMRRELVEQTGGFDPGLILRGGGEMEFCYRLWALGYECRIAPQARVAHMFRSKFPYAVSAVDVLHNLLRIAVIHFDRERVGAVIAALGKNPVFPQAMALLLDSDVSSRRADLRSRRILDDQAFFDRFPTPGLSHEPLDVHSPIDVAIQPGRMASGSHGPSVNSWVRASRASMPHLAAVDR